MNASQERPTRIWYVTDLHGSVLCYWKLLAVAAQAAKEDLFDAIIVGGDLCGVRLVPILHASDHWLAELEGQQIELESRDAFLQFCYRLSFKGHYPYECTLEESTRLRDHPIYAQSVLDQQAVQRVTDWLSQIAQILPDESAPRCRLLVNTGTGDPIALDDLLARQRSVFFSENKVLLLRGDVSIASTSHRELPGSLNSNSEVLMRRKLSLHDFRERIRKLLYPVPDMRRCVLNFHIPPYDTIIDRFWHQESLPTPDRHSGSPIVRKVIELYQPLASLHGYAHDARGCQNLDETVSFNPGAEYYNGRLPGVLLQIAASGELTYSFTEDPLEEAQLATDERIFRAVVKAAVKNLLPVVGPLFKVLDDVLKEIKDEPKPPQPR